MQQFRYTITAVLPRHSFGFYILTFLTIWQGLKNQQRHHNQSHYLYRANRYGTFAVSASIPILHPSLLTRFLLHVTKFNQIVNAFCIIDIFTTYSTLFTNLNILSLTLEALFCARQTLSPFSLSTHDPLSHQHNKGLQHSFDVTFQNRICAFLLQFH